MFKSFNIFRMDNANLQDNSIQLTRLDTTQHPATSVPILRRMLSRTIRVHIETLKRYPHDY